MSDIGSDRCKSVRRSHEDCQVSNSIHAAPSRIATTSGYISISSGHSSSEVVVVEVGDVLDVLEPRFCSTLSAPSPKVKSLR